jgi:multidrug efflux pump subunit AcrA (membrane-fusion protein)
MSSENDNKALLHQLRIDRTHSAADTSAPRRYWLLGAALALLVLLGALWFTLGRARALPVHVAATRAVPGGASASASVLDATGYVTARREATVSAQITGTITAVLIEEGDHVKEGQVIGRLDDTAQRAALAQAQAALHSAQSQLIQDQVQLAQSGRDLKRAEDLVKRNLVSEQAVEQARTQVDAPSAQLDGKKRQIDLDTANLSSIKVQLDYCRARALHRRGDRQGRAGGGIVSPFSAGGASRAPASARSSTWTRSRSVDVNEAYINRVQPGSR